jgi:hypothetical protein
MQYYCRLHHSHALWHIGAHFAAAHLADSKVSQLDETLAGHEDIIGLDVTVHDANLQSTASAEVRQHRSHVHGAEHILSIQC